MDEATRIATADRIRVASDVQLPHLELWNYDPCADHESVTMGCRKCGIVPRKHQRVGISWLYFVKRGLLADAVGTGKTVHAAGLLTLMKERGELDRAVVVMRPAALYQWYDELRRMSPKLHVDMAIGQRPQRIDRYLAPWEVMLIGYQMLLRDYELLLRFQPSTIIVDDVDALRNRQNKTAYAIKKVAQHADRCVIMTGTPLQKRLHELHSVLEPLGGRDVFGSQAAFMHRYVRTEPITIYNHNTGRKMTQQKVVGYKNVDEFKRLVAPLALRRTAADIDDVDLPELSPNDVWLDLYPAQRERYKELQSGVVRIMREGEAKLKRADVFAKLLYGAQICAGLASLGERDLPETSCKLDWLVNELTGDLEDEKVVVFCAYKNTIRALHARLDAEGVGYVTVWGDEPDKAVRESSRQRFWDDPRVRVLIGTNAIEQSLNLQVARHLVNIDLIMNPARMEQLAGRIRRDGSPWSTVYVHNVLTRDTQEERYLPHLEREQALIDYVWGEESELFDSLSPMQLLHLIAP